MLKCTIKTTDPISIKYPASQMKEKKKLPVMN